VDDRDFRALFNDADWASLRLCVVLVCRDALTQARSTEQGWSRLAENLHALGGYAAEHNQGQDLALRVLADFADAAICRDTMARAKTVVATQPERRLTAITGRAASAVDRAAPDQGFQFRATLILASMLAGGGSSRH
jgi:hypothetical protein